MQQSVVNDSRHFDSKNVTIKQILGGGNEGTALGSSGIAGLTAVGNLAIRPLPGRRQFHVVVNQLAPGHDHQGQVSVHFTLAALDQKATRRPGVGKAGYAHATVDETVFARNQPDEGELGLAIARIPQVIAATIVVTVGFVVSGTHLLGLTRAQ